jgi:hypothetical protein
MHHEHELDGQTARVELEKVMDRREFSAALFASCIAWRSTNVETVKLLQGDRLGPEAALGPAAGPTAVVSEPLYQYDKTKWLYIGCENDHPKSWTFMGGGLAPGQGPVIQYSVSIGDRHYYPEELAAERLLKIAWHLKDGYLPCPVSQWHAGPILVQIEHFAARIFDKRVTAVFTRVTVTNQSAQTQSIRLRINASPSFEIPLNGVPTESTTSSMAYELKIGAGKTATDEFVVGATGSLDASTITGADLNYDEFYARMVQGYNNRIDRLTHPVTLPRKGLVDMYKSIQIMEWINVVTNGDECEIHAGAGNPMGVFSYDREFTHDTPNYLDQFMREGDYELAKRILASTYYKSLALPGGPKDDLYLDTLGKCLLPYAQYLQCTDDTAYFTAAVCESIKTAAHNIHLNRVFDDPEHKGLIRKSSDFENWSRDFVLADNWSALHGLQAYKYVCEKLGDQVEAHWAREEMADLNNALNQAIDRYCARNRTDYYLGALDDLTVTIYKQCVYSWVPYSAALATFPWGAYLRGFDLGGAWKDRLDASIEYALKQRDEYGIPSGSWGAWWGSLTYGSTYNASAGSQCLFSERFRTEAIKNIEFLFENQCAPFQWSEAFEDKGPNEWVGMYKPAYDYGNYESWGANFSKQTLLQACVSVAVDGRVIIGRGIPDHWLHPGSEIEWANVNINAKRLLNFRIRAQADEISLETWGDERFGDLLLNLPAFKGNVLSASAGKIDVEAGSVTLVRNEHAVRVRLRKPIG